MAVFAGPRIDTNGLIYCIDPGNTRSYNITGSGTVLTNSTVGLTGSSNLRVGAVIGRRFGGSIALDGLNDYVTLPKVINWDLGSYGYSNITYQFWIYNSNDTSFSILSRYYNSGNGTKSISISSSTYFGIQGRTNYSTHITSNWTFTTNTWHNIAVCISPTTITIYKNGTQSFSGSHGITLGYNGTFDSMDDEGVVIGTGVPYNYPPHQDANGSLEGYVGVVHIYDKFLSADEVSTNFKEMRARYNV